VSTLELISATCLSWFVTSSVSHCCSDSSILLLSMFSCDSKQQLTMALQYIHEHGGAIIYLQQEGRGIGLANKVAAYALQDQGYDTVDANTHLGFPEDCRQYGVVPPILEDMGIESIRLMTNNPRKIDRLAVLGINVPDTIPMVVKSSNEFNRKYLQTKQDRMNHRNFGEMLSLDPRGADGVVEDAVEALREEGAKHPNSIAEVYINEGEETAAAAITSALTVDDAEGVTANSDGYCFGRDSVENAIAAVARGEIVVVVDDMDRENEGDFIMAADLCTPETMGVIVRYSSGVICIGMEGERMDELKLPAMVQNSQDPKETAFSVTVDAAPKHGTFIILISNFDVFTVSCSQHSHLYMSTIQELLLALAQGIEL
jgi:GTP cyclohydrolase II